MINAPKAEGPARNEPEQSPPLPPGSPSGVVEAREKIRKVLDAADKMLHQSHAGKAMGSSLPCCPAHAAIDYAREALDELTLAASIPHAPATPAAAPVKMRCKKCGQVDTYDSPYCVSAPDGIVCGGDLAPTQGVEGPRKEARECWVLFDKFGQPGAARLIGPSTEVGGFEWVRMSEVREGCTVDERTLANCDGRVRIEILGLRQKVESLEADNKALRITLEDMLSDQRHFAKLRALEGAARDAFMEGFNLGHGRGQDWASTGSVKKYAEDGWEYSDAKEKLEKAEPHPTKGEEDPIEKFNRHIALSREAPGVVEALECLDRLERILSSEGFRMEPEIAKIRRALSTPALQATTQEARGMRRAVTEEERAEIIGVIQDRDLYPEEKADQVLASLSIPRREPQNVRAGEGRKWFLNPDSGTVIPYEPGSIYEHHQAFVVVEEVGEAGAAPRDGGAA